MKTYNKYIALAALAFGFISCTQEEIAPQQSDIVKIASANIATEAETRVNTLGDGDAFEENDKILVVSNSRQDKNQGTYTYNGSTWSLTEGMLLYAASGTNDFTAYYPATASFTLPKDQSTETKIKSADRMKAMIKHEYKGFPVMLTFNRQNAKVTITPSLASEYAGKTISAMTIQGVTPYKSSSAYTAILEPSNGFSVSVTVNGKTLTATSTQELVAGKHYSLYLTVGKNAASVNVNVAKVAEWGTGATLTSEVAEEGMVIPYLTFTPEDFDCFSLTVLCCGNYTLDESLQYSVGGDEWTQLHADTKIDFDRSRPLRIRGKSATGTATDIENYARFSFTGGITCSGDIRTLVDYENYHTVNTGSARFCKLFSSTSLRSAPELPATVLADNCYNSMFSGCSGLTEAPELPATVLSDNCYNSMFSRCQCLTTGPVLPATTLASQCYYLMFNCCYMLNNVTMLATDISAYNCLSGWLSGVPSGTVYVAKQFTDEEKEYLCLPSGWRLTVRN